MTLFYCVIPGIPKTLPQSIPWKAFYNCRDVETTLAMIARKWMHERHPRGEAPVTELTILYFTGGQCPPETIDSVSFRAFPTQLNPN